MSEVSRGGVPTDAGLLNSYDAIKLLALVIMTIDHIGAYLYPDELWWRAVGRVTFPVWFFLAGYSRSLAVSVALFATGGVMLAAHLWLGYPIFPLNALFSIAICRLLVGLALKQGWLERYALEIGVGCLMLLPVPDALWEYGTVGVAYAVLGAMVRHGFPPPLRLKFGAYCLVLFLATQLMAKDYTLAQMTLIVAGTTATVWYLLDFTVRPVAVRGMPAWAIDGARFLSRQSLYYYAVHRILLQAIGVYVLHEWPQPRCFWVSGLC